MESTTKHTLIICALLISAVGALTVGLYLKAMNAGEPATTAAVQEPAAPADMPQMHEEMMKEMPGMHEKMMGEGMMKKMPGMEEEMMTTEEGIAPDEQPATAPDSETELSEEELAAILDTVSTTTGAEEMGMTTKPTPADLEEIDVETETETAVE